MAASGREEKKKSARPPGKKGADARRFRGEKGKEKKKEGKRGGEYTAEKDVIPHLPGMATRKGGKKGGGGRGSSLPFQGCHATLRGEGEKEKS